jgi:hypothetical protein
VYINRIEHKRFLLEKKKIQLYENKHIYIMQNQLHNQQQQSSPSLTPSRLEENQMQYRYTELLCECQNMAVDKRDPERCARCNRKYDPSIGNLELLYNFNFPLNITITSNYPIYMLILYYC